MPNLTLLNLRTTTLNPEAFADIPSLRSLNITNGGQLEIAPKTLQNIPTLQHLEIRSSNPEGTATVTLRGNAFLGLGQLTTLDLNKVTSIHPQAFNGLTELTSLKIKAAELPAKALLPLQKLGSKSPGSPGSVHLQISKMPHLLHLASLQVACDLHQHMNPTNEDNPVFLVNSQTAIIIEPWHRAKDTEEVKCLISVGDKIVTITDADRPH